MSGSYDRLEGDLIPPELVAGWTTPEIAARQGRLVRKQLKWLHRGSPEPVFVVAAGLLRATDVALPEVLEIGCASGYYSEVFTTLFGPIRYTGVDYSAALVRDARKRYSDRSFVVADATSLPFEQGSFDVAFSSAVLMHVPDYRTAIREADRVSRGWCIFHRTPVVSSGKTILMRKQAYGTEVFEQAFAEEEFLTELRDCQLDVLEAAVIEEFSLGPLPQTVRLMSYLCRRRRGSRGSVQDSTAHPVD